MKEKSDKDIKKCEMCKKIANCICFKCQLYFCETCFKIVHDSQENKNHKKDIIDNFIPIDTKCSIHPTVPLNLFCVDEKGKNISLYN